MQLEAVLENKMCSGCGLCVSLLGRERATMRYDEDGFLRPAISGAISPGEQTLIEEVCPGSRVRLPDHGRGVESPEFGPVLATMTGYAVDPELRYKGASGGALSALLFGMLQRGEADVVLHVEASSQTPWLNDNCASSDPAAIVRTSGSRYAPSAPLQPLLEHLAAGRRIVVVGKPCDISALRALEQHDDRVRAQVVLMIAFLCGGVPSTEATEDLVRRTGAQPLEVATFRYRGEGWPGKATAVTHSGGQFSLSYAESWGEVLSKNIQRRCKVCADGTGMSADLSFGDAWECDARGYPIFEEQEGRSLILVRTPRGETALEENVTAGFLTATPSAAGTVAHMQPFQIRRTQLVLSRLAALAVTGHRTVQYTGSSLFGLAAKAGLKSNVRSFMGSLLRIIRRRF